MKKTLLVGGCGLVAVIGLLALGLGLYMMTTYNSIVTGEQSVAGAWSQVQNDLQRRGDLIPNLVETVKGYASHEKEVFESVAEARSRLAGAATPQEAAAANSGMTSALGRLLAIAENYPELKANQNFTRLQDELAGSENRIANSRRDYNEQVRRFNSTIVRFPTNMVASFFGKTPKEFFEAAPGKQEVPKVAF